MARPRKRWLWLLLAAGAYLSLWACTARIGAPQVQRAVLHDFVSFDGRHQQRTPGPYDYCVAKAYAPFIVCAYYSFGPGMRGCGGTQLYVWAFGRKGKLLDLSYWVS